MTHWQVLLVATITWIACLAAEILRHRARNDPGAITIFPALLMPLPFWGLAYVSHRADFPFGATAIGVLHLAFLAGMVVSMSHLGMGHLSRRQGHLHKEARTSRPPQFCALRGP